MTKINIPSLNLDNFINGNESQKKSFEIISKNNKKSQKKSLKIFKKSV